MANHLINETSPYLLQHAHNPVEWYPWGDDALSRATREDKPILVSIGYAACHWCHVMERESFEDEETARLMNEKFINIKIDREERPDLDHIYMDAVQAITGSGGWPLNVFLTPSRKPFFGGTYFPPRQVMNRSSWREVLQQVSAAFTEKRHEIEAQADNLTSHIEASNHFGVQQVENTGPLVLSNDDMQEMFGNLMKTADKVEGGFGRAPKFPQTFSIRYLLQYHFYFKEVAALDQACLSLDKMIDGGINDQLGGGFARYSTDEVWLAPHFEKMLYDNALLVSTLADAYQITGRDKYRNAIRSTLDFVERELLSGESGFYSALDADSEGVEGKFYVWTSAEIGDVLGKEAAGLFNDYYGVTESGNWEHTNILHSTSSAKEFAERNNMAPDLLEEFLRILKEKLLMARGKRVRPVTDDKVLLGWNCMMNAAYCRAFMATGEEKYRMLATGNMSFILEKMRDGGEGGFFHTYKNGIARYPAFLDDYANLIHALLCLQEITGNSTYLEKVKTLIKWVIAHFSEQETDYFYFTNDRQEDVIVRKKELYDGAVASGNSLMAWNLYYCGVVFDQVMWRERAVRMCSGLKEVVKKYPGSFGVWAATMQVISKGVPEIAVVGSGADGILKDLLRIFIPFRIIQSSPSEMSGFPLLEGKPLTDQPMIYLCKDYSCQSPVTQVSALQRMLDETFTLKP